MSLAAFREAGEVLPRVLSAHATHPLELNHESTQGATSTTNRPKAPRPQPPPVTSYLGRERLPGHVGGAARKAVVWSRRTAGASRSHPTQDVRPMLGRPSDGRLRPGGETHDGNPRGSARRPVLADHPSGCLAPYWGSLIHDVDVSSRTAWSVRSSTSWALASESMTSGAFGRS